MEDGSWPAAAAPLPLESARRIATADDAPRPPSPATSPIDVMTADLSGKQVGAVDQSPLLALAASLLGPIEKLENLIGFEEARAFAAGVDSPLLPGLVATAAGFRQSLAEHGILSTAPAPWDDFDPRRHEVASLRVRPAPTRSSEAAAATACAAALADLVVVECHRDGLFHQPSGLVLRKAVVVTRAKVRKAPPRSCHVTGAEHLTAPAEPASGEVPEEGNVGEQLHAVQPHDTLQGIALRYGVSPATLIRYNKLPGTDAFHLRTALLIPPPPAERRIAFHRASRGGREEEEEEGVGDEGAGDEGARLLQAPLDPRTRPPQRPLPSRRRPAACVSRHATASSHTWPSFSAAFAPSFAALTQRWLVTTKGSASVDTGGMHPTADMELASASCERMTPQRAHAGRDHE